MFRCRFNEPGRLYSGSSTSIHKRVIAHRRWASRCRVLLMLHRLLWQLLLMLLLLLLLLLVLLLLRGGGLGREERVGCLNRGLATVLCLEWRLGWPRLGVVVVQGHYRRIIWPWRLLLLLLLLHVAGHLWSQAHLLRHLHLTWILWRRGAHLVEKRVGRLGLHGLRVEVLLYLLGDL
jgi:hypothetical protein